MKVIAQAVIIAVRGHPFIFFGFPDLVESTFQLLSHVGMTLAETTTAGSVKIL